MVRDGDNPRDFRSEAERVKARSDMPSFETEYHRGKRAPDRVEAEHPHRFEGADASELSAQKLWSDQSIRQRVVDILEAEPWASTSDISVEVEGGVVLLTGSVDTINTKYRTGELAKRFAGVVQVDNQLKIRVGNALDEFTRGFDAVRARANGKAGGSESG